MTETIPMPIENAYWVIPGRLMAGEYPGAHAAKEASQRLSRFIAAGVRSFIDLTYPGEFGIKPYDSILDQPRISNGEPMNYSRFPIGDMRVPTPEGMKAILDSIDESMEAGRTVYLHCYGGLGRTGTVIGCYLVRHGMSGDQALLELRRLRRDTPESYLDSPQTPEQAELILLWKSLDKK